VRIGSRPVDSPVVSRSNVLVAMNEPSLRKFLPDVEPGGIVLYNTEEPLPDGLRADVRMVARHFTGLADQIGSSKAANIVILGALLEASGILEEKFVLDALKKKVKSQRWLDIDIAAMEAGRREIREGGGTMDENGLRGV
jgi:Pyruvate/2-oxoacid:ferredoxin oxidoreductase gamma subunit